MRSIIRDFQQDVIKNCIENSKSFIQYRENNLIALKTNNSYKKKIILTAGVHGSEPAGVFGLINNLDLLNIISQRKEIEFLIFPCLNPTGFERNTRNNINNLDLNRNFELNSQVEEIAFLLKIINNLNFKAELSLDFHETCPEDNCDITQGNKLPTEFYLYEVCLDDKLKIGRKLIDNLEKQTSICSWDNIFGDKAVNGVISYPQNSDASESFSGKTLDLFLFNNGFTKNALTIETMAHLPMKERINQIKTILNCL